MRWLWLPGFLASLCGCASIEPLAEAERARIRVVAPLASRVPPQLDLAALGKAGGATLGAAIAAAQVASLCIYLAYARPGAAACAAWVATGAAVGAAGSPSANDIEKLVQRARVELGAFDIQQLLARRFSDRVTRLTPLVIDPAATQGEGALTADLAVTSVRANLVGATQRAHVRVSARLRLVRPSDGAVVMTRDYQTGRYGRLLHEYEADRMLLLQVIAGAVNEIATLMVDDAFLRAADAAVPEPLAPLPAGRCLTEGYDCWVLQRVPQLATASPTFRWKPSGQADKARNLSYDLWIFGGEDDRIVEGLRATEHTLTPPLADCARYSWAVRARFDTDTGPRTGEWSTASSLHRSAFGPGTAFSPTFGAPFMTPCR